MRAVAVVSTAAGRAGRMCGDAEQWPWQSHERRELCDSQHTGLYRQDRAGHCWHKIQHLSCIIYTFRDCSIRRQMPAVAPSMLSSKITNWQLVAWLTENPVPLFMPSCFLFKAYSSWVSYFSAWIFPGNGPVNSVAPEPYITWTPCTVQFRGFSPGNTWTPIVQHFEPFQIFLRVLIVSHLYRVHTGFI